MGSHNTIEPWSGVSEDFPRSIVVAEPRAYRLASLASQKKFACENPSPDVSAKWLGLNVIREGNKGCIFEVTPDGDVVREFISPHFVQSEQFGRHN